MKIYEVLLIGVSLAMDAFAVSVTNSLSAKKNHLSFSLKQSGLFGFFQALMPIIGYFVGISFSSRIASAGKYVAFGLLALIGGKMIYEAVFKKDDENLSRKGSDIRLKYLILLAISTSIDALAVGVTFSCSGVNKISTLLIYTALIGIETFIICMAGSFAGKKFGRLLGGKAEIFGGVILIIIGMKILIF